MGFGDIAKLGKIMAAAGELKEALATAVALDADKDGVADIKELQADLASLQPLEEKIVTSIKDLFGPGKPEPTLSSLYGAAGPELLQAFTTLEKVGELLKEDASVLEAQYGATFAGIVASLA